MGGGGGGGGGTRGIAYSRTLIPNQVYMHMHCLYVFTTIILSQDFVSGSR